MAVLAAPSESKITIQTESGRKSPPTPSPLLSANKFPARVKPAAVLVVGQPRGSPALRSQGGFGAGPETMRLLMAVCTATKLSPSARLISVAERFENETTAIRS